jgi:hypothetical protein
MRALKEHMNVLHGTRQAVQAVKAVPVGQQKAVLPVQQALVGHQGAPASHLSQQQPVEAVAVAAGVAVAVEQALLGEALGAAVAAAGHRQVVLQQAQQELRRRQVSQGSQKAVVALEAMTLRSQSTHTKVTLGPPSMGVAQAVEVR